MKKLLALALVAMFLFVAACGDGGDSGSSGSSDPVVAYICKDLTQTWFIDLADGMEEVVTGRGGELLLFDVGMSPDRYIEALDSVVSRGDVDVLVVTPPDQALSQLTVERAAEAGIKVFACCDGLIDDNGVHIAPAQELDAEVVGNGIGEWLGNYVKDNNISSDDAMYMIMHMPDLSVTVPRGTGARDSFMELLPDWPADKIMFVDYNGQTEESFNAAAATITANPQITTWLVSAANDEGSLGALRAIEQAGLDANATVVGLGGYHFLDEVDIDNAFKAASWFSAKYVGRSAGTAAMDWIQNGTVPFTSYITGGKEFGVYGFGGIMITAENYQEVMG